MWEVCRKSRPGVQADQSRVDQGWGSALLRDDEPALWHQRCPSFSLMRKRKARVTGPFSSFSSHWHCSHKCVDIKTGRDGNEGDEAPRQNTKQTWMNGRNVFFGMMCIFVPFPSDTHLLLHVKEIRGKKGFLSLLRNIVGISALSQRSKKSRSV